MVHTRIRTLALTATLPVCGWAQSLGGEMATEIQWSPNAKTTNLMTIVRLDFEWSPWKRGSIEAATIHMAKTNEAESIVPDYQTFSNIQENNCLAAIATLGYRHVAGGWQGFIGTRNMNEDYFTSPVTSFFTSSSPGIFPTISATYPIANYPVASPVLHMEYAHGAWTAKNSLYTGTGYNGWQRGDNPFCLRPRQDGLFDVMELSHDSDGHYYSAGAAIHNRTCDQVSAAWWVYAEQRVWQGEDAELSLMAQYSENTLKASTLEQNGEGCKRYAELGCLYTWGENSVGASVQYGHFAEGKEQTVELTWSREVASRLSVQPVINYIHNNNGDYAVLSGRLIYTF